MPFDARQRPGEGRWWSASDRWIWRVVDAVLLACVLAMAATIGVQVVSRLSGLSQPWTEELSRILFIWTAFLGMAGGFRRLEHPRIMLVLDRAPRQVRQWFAHVYAVAGVGFFVTVGVYASRFVRQQFAFGETSPVLGLGMYLVSLPMVLSSALAVIAILTSVYGDAGTRRRIIDGEARP